MMLFGRHRMTITVVLVTAVAAVLPAAVAAGTSFDPYSTGYVGLCDRTGHNVTHGSVYDKPFVSRAVSSVPAPASLRGSGRRATLVAYRPRKGIDPGEWSGDTLTAASAYSNAAAPMAQATGRDFALSDYLNEYPPLWDGLVELRMYFSAVNRNAYTNSYPVAVIRVTGTTWSLVQGGRINCRAGTASSPEDSLPPTNHSGLQPPQRLSGVASHDIAAGAAGGTVALPATAATAGGSQPAAAALAPSSERALSGGHDPTLVGAIVLLAVAAAGGSWLWLRHRNTPHRHRTLESSR